MRVLDALLLFAIAAVGVSAIDNHISYQTDNGDVNISDQLGLGAKRYNRSVFGSLFGSTPYYTCDFLPTVSFFPERGAPLPVYKCVLDASEVLIATTSFHSAKERRDFVTRATVVLDNVILSTVYPGTFRATNDVLFRGVGGGSSSFNSPVAINGLLVLSTPNLKTGLFNYFSSEKYSCEFLPYVNFYVETYGQLPAYKCIRGNNEVLIATNSFRYSQNEFIHNVEVVLSENVLKTKYPGSFIQVIGNNFTSVTGLNYIGNGVAINGLLPLTLY